MSKRHASGESNLLAQISGVAKALSFEAWALTSIKKNSYSKPLCHGFLGHVVIQNQKLLVNDKITASWQTNRTAKHYIKRCKQQNEKLFKLTSFQNHNCNTFQSSFSVEPVCPSVCPFVLCICGFNTFFSCFDQLLFSFTQIGGSCHCLKFHNFHDTAPLIK